MITVHHSNRSVELPGDAARRPRANVWEVRVPDTEEIARPRLRDQHAPSVDQPPVGRAGRDSR